MRGKIQLFRKEITKKPTIELFTGITLIIFFLFNGLCLAYEDKTAPTRPLVLDDGEYANSSNSLYARLISRDLETSIVEYRYCIGTAPYLCDIFSWKAVKLARKYFYLDTKIKKTGLNLKEGISYYFTVVTINSAGLVSQPGISNGITVDNAPPAGKIIINKGETYTNSREVLLTISASDNLSGLSKGAQMQFSPNKIIWSRPEPYVATKNFRLSWGDGSKFVYARVKDVAGNWSQPFYDSIILDTIPPWCPVLYTVVTPTSSSYQNISGKKDRDSSLWLNNKEIIPCNSDTTWSYNINLNDGPNPIVIYSKDKAGNCSSSVSSSIFYDSTLPLQPRVVDDGDYTNSAVELHASWESKDPETEISEYSYAIGTIQGEDGTDIKGWQSVGSKTGITTSGLKLCRGQKYYFNVKARNAADSWSEVGSSDGIIVSNQNPTIISLLPQDNSRFTAGDTIRVVVQAQDADNDDLKYRYLVDGEVVEDWISQADYLWQTQAGDIRLKTITVEVKDEHNALARKEVKVFLFRKPPQPK